MVIGSINSFTLNIFSLNLFKYARVNPSSCWATQKRSVEFFLACMLMLKHATSLTHRSLNPSIEFSSKLLYQAHVDPLKVVRSIFHIESRSWMINSKLLRIFCTCSFGAAKPSQLSKLVFIEI